VTEIATLELEQSAKEYRNHWRGCNAVDIVENTIEASGTIGHRHLRDLYTLQPCHIYLDMEGERK